MIYKSGYYGCFKHFYYVGVYMYIFIVCQKSVLYLVLYEHDYNDRSARTHAHSNLVRYNSKYLSWKCKVRQRFFYFNETHCSSGKQLKITHNILFSHEDSPYHFCMMVPGLTGKTRIRKGTLSCAVSRLKKTFVVYPYYHA